MARPRIWAAARELALMRAVNAELTAKGLKHDSRHAVRDACAALARRPPWQDYAPDTLRQHYYAARKHRGKEPKVHPSVIVANYLRWIDDDVDPALIDEWIAKIEADIRDPRYRKRRIYRSRAFQFVLFILRKIKQGEGPQGPVQDAERLLKRMKEREEPNGEEAN
jgi:hypothetical protein